ncbi:annexin A1-like isoform 2-T2 [Discoglossus pictus]
MEQQSSTSIVQQMLQACQQCQVSSTQEQETQQVHVETESKPQTKFDPTDDVTALEKAISAKEVDEGTIIDIITKRTNDQRQQIKAAYEKKTGKSLEEGLKKVLSGQLETIILALLRTPAQFDADELKHATKGIGTDENCLIEILASRSNQEIKQIKKVYSEEYKTDLEKDIIGDTSGDFQKLLLTLLKGERSEDCFVYRDQSDADAKALYEAGENAKKVDANVFIDILTSRSSPHLQSVFEKYATYSKHDINKTLDLQMKGDIESGLVAIVKCAVSKPAFFAEQLNLAMQGTGERALNRVMVSRSEIDMKDIKDQYKKLYGKSLRDAIMEKAKGEYETVLVALCGYDN